MGYIGSGPTRFNTADELTVTGDAELKGNTTIDGNLTVSGTTTSISSASVQTVNLGDNDKIQLGDGNDLQIYHDGSNSWIRDEGTGALYIRASTELALQSATGDNYLQAISDGTTRLFYDHGTKLATTATGVDVTGTVTADGLTVDGDVDVQSHAIDMGDNTTSVPIFTYNTNPTTSGATIGQTAYEWNGTKVIAIEGKSGDDTTNKDNGIFQIRVAESGNLNSGGLFVLDHNGNLGVGTTSDGSIGHFKNATGNATLKVEGGTTAGNDAYANIEIGNTTGTSAIYFSDTTNGVGRITYEHNGDYMRMYTASTERMRIDSSGNILLGGNNLDPQTLGSGGEAATFRAGGTQLSVAVTGTVGMFNRTTSDGTVIQIRQNGTEEGNITVSGTTVSYNGGHLARWSRLADDSKDETIVKGTVMTNLDEMVEWSHDAVDEVLDEEGNVVTEAKEAYTEDNEQLNKMAVSSVEGDANVAGVFVNWDEDDDWNDMNVAMTGDMVIRIAQGTTVARGDLLMSAGDGTAKPQGDDIVRSKTIAKVTSTHVSHTYDDGSYLVPCVLMAC